MNAILRLEKDQNNKTRLLKQAVLQMEKPYPPGSILMDVPPHESMEDLVDYAHDFDRWSIWTNAILDPEHACHGLRATNYYRQDQDRGPQERKKKAKTHLPSKGCAQIGRAHV